MLSASLKQCGRRLAGSATAAQRASFSTAVGSKGPSALSSRRRELALMSQNVARRSYAAAAQDTNKGVVCIPKRDTALDKQPSSGRPHY